MIDRSVREAALTASRKAGLFSVSANSGRRRNRLLILCYHGISCEDEDRWAGHLYISPARFERRLELLRSFGANVLNLGEAVTALKAGKLPPRSVVITFDDGFADFHTHAVPLLRRFGYPATVYLTTHYSQHRLPIFNLMANYLIWKSGRSEIELPAFGVDRPISVASYEGRVAVVHRLLEWAETHAPGSEEKDDIARSIADGFGIDYDAILASRILQIMNEDEVAATARAGIDIELHTHRHRTPRDRDLFLREIRDNAALIRDLAGREPLHFCYPSGDYDRQFLPWLAESGVRSATTCLPGLATADADSLLLPRMLDDSGASEVTFERWLSGFFV